MTEPIPMRHVLEPDGTESKNLVAGLMQPGDFYWRRETGKQILVVAIPNGSDFIRLDIPVDVGLDDPDAWDWNFNLSKPTLEQPVHISGVQGGWSGRITDGMLIEDPILNEQAAGDVI